MLQGPQCLLEIIHNRTILKKQERTLIEHRGQVQTIQELLDLVLIAIEQVRLQEILEKIRLAENQVAQIHVHIVKETNHLEVLK